MKTSILSITFYVALFALAVSSSSMAQMVPDITLVAQSPDLQLDGDHASKVFTVRQTAAPNGVNVIWPGEPAPVTLTITNTSGEPIQTSGKIEVIQYAVQGIPGDGWLGKFVKIADVQTIPIDVNIPAKGTFPVDVNPAIPATFGGYALIVDLGTYGRRFGCAIARTLPADGGRVRIPAYALDINQPSQETFYLFKRLGVKGARMELGATLASDPHLADKTAALDDLMKSMWDNEVTTMLTVSTGNFPQPLGRPRPFLDDDGVMMETKSDICSLPANDPDFQTWSKTMSDSYGWPKGPINAMELWNEPWEGISISGWGADMTRYRALYTAMAQGIEESRAQSKTDVLIGGTCSSSNTMDKLFPDGSDTFLKWLDFASLHYQPFSALPALEKEWLNRKNAEGPTQAWDTESWIANCDDRVGIAVAAMHSMGQQRAMGVFGGNVYTTESFTDGGQKKHIVQAWSTSASVAASQKFIGQRKFQQLLFKNGLPWILVFDGLPNDKGVVNPDDGTVVVVGDFSGVFDRTLLLFRNIYGLKNGDQARALKKQLAAATDPAQVKDLTKQLSVAQILDGGSLTLSDGGGKFGMKDFYGNDVASSGGKIVVPLNGLGYFLRTDGKSGSFAALLDELRKSRIEGYEPVDVKFHDFTDHMSAHPAVRLTLTNVLNRPISGTVHLDVDHLKFDPAGMPVQLAANETKDVSVPLQSGDESPDNSYMAHLTFDAGTDGKAVSEDHLHVNLIAHRTITVDGKLDDWKDVLPQPITGPGIVANMTEKAWLPFMKYDDSVKTGVATGYMAYDDKNFYFAARVADGTPDPGMVRTATRDDDAYFYPDKSFEIDPVTAIGKKEVPVDSQRTDLGERMLQMPEGNVRSNEVWQGTVKMMEIDLELPTNELHQVSFYFLDGDAMGRQAGTVDMMDGDTGKVLDTQKISGYPDGKYWTYQLSGNVKIRFTTALPWMHFCLAGMFFDSVDGAPSASGNSAKFMNTDEKSRGNWKGVYGKDGYLVVSAPEKDPSYAKVTVPEVLNKTEHDWPAEVPRYSYRKRPELPGDNKHDNVQIAFNVLPDDQKPYLMNPAGTMPKYECYPDTDYEYALNPVAAAYGGGTEVWRLNCPGMPHKHFFPRQPKSKFDGAVKDAQLVCTHDGNTRIVEAAIPWTEIPEVKKKLDAGETIKFSYRVNDNGGPSVELATDRTVSKNNFLAFHNDFATHWANEVEFKFEK